MRKVSSGHLFAIEIQWFYWRTVNSLISLCVCAGWSRPSLSAYAQRYAFARLGPIDIHCLHPKVFDSKSYVFIEILLGICEIPTEEIVLFGTDIGMILLAFITALTWNKIGKGASLAKRDIYVLEKTVHPHILVRFHCYPGGSRCTNKRCLRKMKPWFDCNA